jgi:hypothetical protein
MLKQLVRNKMKSLNINMIDDAYHLHEMLPAECINDCSCSGDNAVACEEWVKKLSLAIPREKCTTILREIGAWDDDEIAKWDDTELNITVLWIAAGYER